MTHYVCSGDCKGVADHQKNCDTASCSMYQQPLIECNCADGQHQDIKDKEMKREEKVVV